ncbi:MAG: TspO/MBR family protein [Hyphomicrobiales bacterium]|jgi:benzodiazapine receptor
MDFSISWSLVAFFIVTFLAAMSGGYFRPGQWYRDLAKPSWNPPDFLFPIAWTVLYAMMAFAAWLVWEEAGWPAALVPTGFWLVQLVFNALWSALFFGMKRMDYALVDVVLLWLSIAATIVLFWPISTLAGWLMVPYLVWVSFAAFLNFTILRLNPQQAV